MFRTNPSTRLLPPLARARTRVRKIVPGTIFAVLLLCSWAEATPRFWIGSGTNWNNTASWSNSSGGGTCTCTPAAGDIAIFDGKGVGNATLNVNVSITSMTVSTSTTGGYTGTITMLSTASLSLSQNLLVNRGTFNVQSSTNVTIVGNATFNGGSFTSSTSSIKVGGNWTAVSGAFTAGTSTVTFTSTSVGQTVTTGNNKFFNVTLNGSGGYWTMQDSMTVVSSMTLTAGTLDTKSGSNFGITVGNSWYNTGGTFVANLDTVTFNGTSAALQIDADPSSYASVVFNGAGTWTLLSPLTLTSTMTFTAGTLNTSASNYPVSVGGSWLNNGGTFIANASTATFTAATIGQKIKSNGKNFSNIQFNGSGGYWTLQDSMTVTSQITLAAGTLDTSVSNLAMTVGGNWFNNGGFFVANQSTVTFTGASAALQLDPNPSPFAILVFNGAGTWTLQSSMTVTSTMTITARER